MLPNLICVCQNPPSLNVSASPEVLNSFGVKLGADEHEPKAEAREAAADIIDWDITIDSSQIDWDIGTMETEDNGNGLGGPYEIVNASDISLDSPHKPVDEAEQIQNLESKDCPVTSDLSLSEISWDVTVESPLVGGAEDITSVLTTVTDAGSTNYYAKTDAIGSNHDRSQLMETEYRNKILDDLFEVSIHLLCYFYVKVHISLTVLWHFFLIFAIFFYSCNILNIFIYLFPSAGELILSVLCVPSLI